VRAVDLRERPATDATAVASLPANAAVDMLKREGAWVHLKSASGAGWAKLFDVRFSPSGAAPARSSSGDALSQTLDLAKGGRSPSVTTGVRGLQGDMLARAQPNPRQWAALESYTASRESAQAFASRGNLASRSVEPLAAAASVRPPAGNSGQPEYSR
jgi:hypothetical protein